MATGVITHLYLIRTGYHHIFPARLVSHDGQNDKSFLLMNDWGRGGGEGGKEAGLSTIAVLRTAAITEDYKIGPPICCGSCVLHAGER